MQMMTGKISEIRHFCTSFSRYVKSKGFGIHSPFAFYFVTRILRERAAYYAYDTIDSTLAAGRAEARRQGIKPQTASRKGCRLMFRIANYFHPGHIVQWGGDAGVSAVSLLACNRVSRLSLIEPDDKRWNIIVAAAGRYASRITRLVAADRLTYDEVANNGMPFVLFQYVSRDEREAARTLVRTIVAQGGVILMRNIGRSSGVSALWKETRRLMTSGMSFGNDRFGVVVCNPKLPLQHFSVWF